MLRMRYPDTHNLESGNLQAKHAHSAPLFPPPT